MATAAVVESSSDSLPFGRSSSGVTMKRKTPSELRGEQLKRRNGEMLADCSLPSSAASNKKLQSSKLPKYINTRVDEVYPIKKSSERCRVIFGKEKDPSTIIEISDDLVTPVVRPANAKPLFACCNAEILNNSKGSKTSAEDMADHGIRNIEKCSQSALRNVVDLHLANDKPSDSAKVDMDKALKSLVARETTAISGSLAVSLRTHDLPSMPSNISFSEFEIPGYKAPLDLTLKTSLRFVSSLPVRWCQRLSASPAPIDISWFTSQCSSVNESQSFGCGSGQEPIEFLYSKALHSWVYPQSTLPSSVISMLTSLSLKGETEFLLKRQQDWEDSFRNLYYMLRKSTCRIFYVFAVQFVVLFVGGNFLGKKRHSCNAYLSRSTRGLRSLLRKHDIRFEMPFCHGEAEHATEDDLVELSEIEKQHLGKAFHVDALSDVDNTPQSLLSFVGNKNVHGLYDFLLNYRFFLSSFSGFDVPLLYAPVPFHNASFHVPEVRSREMRKADAAFPSSSKCDKEENEALPDSYTSGICYSVEVNDTVVPPWVVSRLCAAMSSDGRSFQASFTTESASIGLNIALDSVCHKSDVPMESKKSEFENGSVFGIPEAILTPRLHSASLRRLKFSDDAYMAYSVPN